MANELPPSEFWVQTPRSFVSIMDGCARRAKRQAEAMISQAWHTEAFARQKKLEPLSKLLVDKPKAQTPDEMLAALMAFQARGANMSIKKLH